MNTPTLLITGALTGIGRATALAFAHEGARVVHWDVIQDESTREQSKSGAPMFGDRFPEGWDEDQIPHSQRWRDQRSFIENLVIATLGLRQQGNSAH